jgi:hypothetical protein
LPGALDFPLDEDALEGLGIELGEYALEGGFLGIIPCAAAFAVAAERPQLGNWVSLAAKAARSRWPRTMPDRVAMTMMASRQCSG